ncbi:circumsporozoite protein-like [Chiroxiphia lanceolata]|uniref:circumsporozoite protein-like n=1 Tax=Chiroxiphia lanceolata TaxID=296741 RepID=UPI0013CEF3B0|nr:circumsporozoite protein-like [Chiroxiphia lanceolata]
MGRAATGAGRGRRGKGETSHGGAGRQRGRGSPREAAARQGGAAGNRRPERGGEGGEGRAAATCRSERAAPAAVTAGGPGGPRRAPGHAPPRPSAGGGSAAIGWGRAGAGPAGGRAASPLAGAAWWAGRGAAARGVGRAGAEREVGGGGGGGSGAAGAQAGPAAPRHPPGAGEPLTNAHCALGDSTVRVTAANLLLGHRCAAASPPRTRTSTPRRPPPLPAGPGEGLRRGKESASPTQRHCPVSSSSPCSAPWTPDAPWVAPRDRPHCSAERGKMEHFSQQGSGKVECTQSVL